MLIDLFSDVNTKCKTDKIIVKETETTIAELQKAFLRFNEATEPDEIESAIYLMKELEMYYSGLLKKAKMEKLCNFQVTGELWH